MNLPELNFGGNYEWRINFQNARNFIIVIMILVSAFSYLVIAGVNINRRVEQVETNTEVNVKQEERLLKLEETIRDLKTVPGDIKEIKDSQAQQEKNWTEFWKNYDVKKKQ